MAKELGADNIVKSAQDLFKSSGNLSSSWGKSAIKIRNLNDANNNFTIEYTKAESQHDSAFIMQNKLQLHYILFT